MVCQKANGICLSVFWDCKGVLMVEFVQQGTSEATSEMYFKTLKNCIGPFKTKGVEF
jgi:hypothetical protein